MPVVLGDPNEGGFSVAQPRPQQRILNMNPGGGGGGGTDYGQLAEYQNQAAMARQQQAAQLQAWTFQQDLTAREQMDLQRRQNALAYVQNDETLSDDEKHDISLQLQTGINVGQQRMQAMQQRRMQQQQQLADIAIQNQSAHERTQAQFRAAGFADEQSYSIDPEVQEQVRSELSQYATPDNPVTNAEVLREAMRRGAVQTWVQSRPGHFEPARQQTGAGGTGVSDDGLTHTRETRTRGGSAPQGSLTPRGHQQTLHEIAADVAHMLPTDAKPSDRKEVYDRLVREHGLISEEDQNAGRSPTYENYLDNITPGRRQRREARQDNERRADDSHRERLGMIQHLPEEQRRRLEQAANAIHDAEHRYAGGNMPRFIENGVRQMRTLFDNLRPLTPQQAFQAGGGRLGGNEQQQQAFNSILERIGRATPPANHPRPPSPQQRYEEQVGQQVQNAPFGTAFGARP